MPGHELPPPQRIARLSHPARGSSQPWFCELDDGETWLVKFRGAGPGPSALLAEHLSSALGRHWSLPVPASKPVWLEASTERAGTDEFWDVLDNSVGWNLAIELIPDAINRRPGTALPPSTLEPMMSFDALLANWDRTQLSENLLEDAQGGLHWIDHGSCRFLQNLGARPPLRLPSNHFLYEIRDEIRPYPLPPPSLPWIRGRLDEVPAEWLEPLGMSPSALAEALAHYLDESATGAG